MNKLTMCIFRCIVLCETTLKWNFHARAQNHRRRLLQKKINKGEYDDDDDDEEKVTNETPNQNVLRDGS